MHHTTGRHQLGLAITAAVAVGVAMTGSAAAAEPIGSSGVSADTLTVVGTQGADQLALRLAPGDPSTLQVDFGDDGSPDQTFNRSTFSHIDVFLLSGSDEFRVDQINGTFADDPVTVDAGRGDDIVATGAGNDRVLGGPGDDAVDGNGGVDSAVLGSGQDTFTWDPGDGSDAVDGGRGNDALVFNGAGGAETMRLSAEGTSSLFLRDPGAIRMDMHGVEVLDLAALGGADSITVDDLSGSTFRAANLDLTAGGAGDGDLVTVTGSEAADAISVGADDGHVDVDGLTADVQIIGSEADNDHLQVNARGGDDEVDVSQAVADLIGISVDLGPGQL